MSRRKVEQWAYGDSKANKKFSSAKNYERRKKEVFSQIELERIKKTEERQNLSKPNKFSI